MTTTTRTTTRAAVLLAGAITTALALTGCVQPPPTPTPTPSASATPSPTPTPTPTAVAAPQSEEEAVAAASAAMDQYMAVRSAIYVDPQEPQDIAAVAEGTAASDLADAAAQLKAAGDYGKGEYTFSVTSGYSIPLGVNGQQVPFGQVNLTGCFDKSGMELFNADGSPSDRSQTPRIVLEPVVIYRPATQSWAVYQLESPDEVEAC